MIARLPAVRYLTGYEHVRLTVYWPDYFVALAKILLPETAMLRHLGNSAMVYADERIPLIDFRPELHTSCHTTLVDHGFRVMTDRSPPTPEDEIYPKYSSEYNFPLVNLPGEKYIVVTPLFTSRTREWNGQSINETIQGIHALGFDTVLLGKTERSEVGNGTFIRGGLPDGFDRSLATVDLIDQLTLPQCLDVLDRASAVVGLDNGLLHLAGCTNTPAVWAFTSVLAQHRIPTGVRTEVVTPDVACYGCQSRVCMIRHDFRQCPFGDYLCIKEITSTKFLQALKKVLDIPM